MSEDEKKRSTTNFWWGMLLMYTILEYWKVLSLDIVQKYLWISRHFDIVQIFLLSDFLGHLSQNMYLKISEFLVKISQFELTEQSIHLDKLFLSLNISDFRCFIKKLHAPLKNVTPFFPSNPPLKPEVLSSTPPPPPPPFWKFGKSFNHPPSRRGAMCTLWY